MSWLLFFLCLVLSFASHAQHPGGVKLAPLVMAEQTRILGQLPLPSYHFGLIEHESCITLTHKRCWSSESRLRTPREEGGGLGQLTRAFNPDGSTRFDALKDIRSRHMAELADLSWSNLYSRPDLQVRAIMLMTRDNLSAIQRSGVYGEEALKMADAAYNGGLRGVFKERAACGLSSWCDPGRWTGNVERFCLKSRAPLYAGRSACDINRHHVTDVWVRARKYDKLAAR